VTPPMPPPMMIAFRLSEPLLVATRTPLFRPRKVQL
jgi:hypothetical protein